MKSHEKLTELLAERDKAEAKYRRAEQALMAFLRRTKLRMETHPVIVHHIVNTEQRRLNAQERAIVYGAEVTSAVESV